MHVDILYEDRDLVLVQKPAGVPSQPDPSGQEDLLSAIQTTHPTARLIHRLDTPTGGVMVFGLHPTSSARLCALVQDHDSFQKEYLAVLSGAPTEWEGRLTDHLYHDKIKNKSFVTDGKRKGSKEAVLDYRILSVAPNGYALALVRLHTGRTHQIRVQFATRGFPLVGDGKYGSREKAPYIGLWAVRLTLPHPKTGKPLSASARPDDTVLPWSNFSHFLQQDFLSDL